MCQETQLALQGSVSRGRRRGGQRLKPQIMRHRHRSLHMQRIGDDQETQEVVLLRDAFCKPQILIGRMRLCLGKDIGYRNTTRHRILLRGLGLGDLFSLPNTTGEQ